MNTDQRSPIHKIHVILQRALVEARNLALVKNCAQIYDLADAFEVVPFLLLRWEDSNVDLIREILQNYQAKHKETAYDYLSILNMDDRLFEESYLATDFAKAL